MRRRRQGKTPNAARRSVRRTQVNDRLSEQSRRLASRHLHERNANPRFKIGRRRGQCEEKKGDSRGTQSQATLEGEEGRTANPYHKARPDFQLEDNSHDEAAVHHIVEAVYERQRSANGEAYQIYSCFCLD